MVKTKSKTWKNGHACPGRCNKNIKANSEHLTFSQ